MFKKSSVSFDDLSVKQIEYMCRYFKISRSELIRKSVYYWYKKLCEDDAEFMLRVSRWGKL